MGRASSIDTSLNIHQGIKETGLPLDKLFNISSDGRNINKTVWRETNDTLKKEGFVGLIPQTSSSLHIVYNAICKGLNMHGEEPEKLVFNSHYWFKNSPCIRFKIFCNWCKKWIWKYTRVCSYIKLTRDG